LRRVAHYGHKAFKVYLLIVAGAFHGRHSNSVNKAMLKNVKKKFLKSVWLKFNGRQWQVDDRSHRRYDDEAA